MGKNSATAAFIVGKVQELRGIKKAKEAEHNLNLAFYLGDQWRYYRMSAGTLDYQSNYRNTPYVINVIKPIVDGIVGQVTSAIPRLMSLPISNETADMIASEIGNTVLDTEVWRGLEMRSITLRMLPVAACLGSIMFHPYYNPRYGKKYSKTDLNTTLGLKDTDEKAVREDKQEGRLEMDVLSPFEYIVDPAATSDSDMRWFIITKCRTQKYVKETWGVDVKPTAGPDLRVSEAYLAYQSELLMQKGPARNQETDIVVVHELWHKPTKEWPKGKWAVCTADGEEIKDEGLPWGLDTLDVLPGIKFDWDGLYGRFDGISPITQARPIQREINTLFNQFIKYKNVYMFPPLMVPSDSGISDMSILNKPGEKVQYTPSMASDRGGAPHYLQPPQFNFQFVEMLNMLKEQIENLFGVSAASTGGVTTGSGRAINLLQSAGETRINPIQIRLEECYGKLGKLCLQIIENTYQIPRLISIVGNSKARCIKDFSGEMLKGNNNVIVELRSALPLNKQAAIDVVNTWMVNGIIPKDNDGLKMAHRMLNLESFAPFFANKLDDEQAEYENSILDMGENITEEQEPQQVMGLDGMPVMDEVTGQPQMQMQNVRKGMPRNSWDNDEAHIKVHEEREKEINFLKLVEENPQVKEAYELHILEHKNAMTQTMQIPGPTEQPMMGGPNGSNIPGGNELPPETNQEYVPA